MANDNIKLDFWVCNLEEKFKNFSKKLKILMEAIM